MLKATQLLLPVNLAEHYIGFYVANRIGWKVTSDGSTRRLWYKHLGPRQASSNSSKWHNTCRRVRDHVLRNVSLCLRQCQLFLDWRFYRMGPCLPIGCRLHSSDTSCGNQVHLGDHVPSLCCRVCCTVHASADRVYGIALYLWFSAEMYLLDDLGESIPRRSVGLRFNLNASLAALE